MTRVEVEDTDRCFFLVALPAVIDADKTPSNE